MLRTEKMKMDFMFTMAGSPDSPAAEAAPEGAVAVPLSSLPVGAYGRVASVEAAAVDLERLEVMGLCAGRVVWVVKDGDPMIVRVLGTRIGLAAALAERVSLLPEALAPGALPGA